MDISLQANKDKQTSTEQIMTDIIRLDLSSEINEFSNHVQNKIERLDERMRFVNYKFEDVRFWFRRYSISIIYLATFLTLIEALMNSFNIDSIEDIILKNFLKFCPLVVSSLVSLIAAIIKFNKYEEKIEDITRATEKCIITIAKLKEVKEELYFCKTVDDFLKINDRFTRDIYTEYLESNTNIERQLLDTDYAKYMKRVANNDVERAKILIQRNHALDELGKLELNKLVSNQLKKSGYKHFYQFATDKSDSSSDGSDIKTTQKTPPNNMPRRLSLSAEHNCKNRPIPYRGISPPPTRPNICNKKMTPKTCKQCKRSYLLDINNKDQRCPYCKTLQEEDLIELIIDKNINNISNQYNSLSPTSDIEEHASYIQKIWRGHKERKHYKNPRNF